MELRTHKLIHLLALQQEQLRTEAQLVCTYFDREDIHRFRVDYKKTRALLRMLHWLEEGDMDHFRMPAPLKQWYRSLGSLRDLQLHFLFFCTNFTGRSQTRNLYLQKVHNESVYIQHQIRGFSAKSIHRFAGQYSQKKAAAICEPDRVMAFAQFQWSRMLQHLQKGPLKDEALHQMRKWVKDGMYNLNSDLPELRLIGPGKEALSRAADLMGASLDARNTGLILQRLMDQLPPSMHEEILIMIRQSEETKQQYESEANAFMAAWLNRTV